MLHLQPFEVVIPPALSMRKQFAHWNKFFICHNAFNTGCEVSDCAVKLIRGCNWDGRYMPEMFLECYIEGLPVDQVEVLEQSTGCSRDQEFNDRYYGEIVSQGVGMPGGSTCCMP